MARCPKCTTPIRKTPTKVRFCPRHGPLGARK